MESDKIQVWNNMSKYISFKQTSLVINAKHMHTQLAAPQK